MLQISVIPNRSASPITTLHPASGRALAGLWTMLAAGGRAWIARRDERHLMEMPDYLLKDVGIGRSQIPSALKHGRT